MATKLKKQPVHMNKGQQQLVDKKLGRAHLFTKGHVANPKGRAPKAFYIPDILKKIGEEWCPMAIGMELRKTFPRIGTISTREAWLRVVYLEAIAGEEWASRFVAERTEGKVREATSSDNKGAILDAIDKLLED